MNLKHVHNYVNTEEATMRIYAEIGGLYGINGADFANEMDYVSKSGVKTINVRINSPGGSILEGQSIMAQIRTLNNGNETVVNTYVDYMAASIAGVIAMCGKKKYIVSNGLFMLHNPSSDYETESDLLYMMKKTLAEQLAVSSGNEFDSIMQMMTRETWLDSKDSIKNGFFDESFPAIIKENLAVKNIHKLYELSNNILTEKPKKMDTNKAELELIEQLKAEKNEILGSKTVAEKKVTDLESELAILKAELLAVKEQDAIIFVENSIKEGKIKADAKDSFTALAKADLANVKNLIDKRYASGRATIIIANLTRKQIFDALGDSIIDRARENGKSIEFNWPSYRSQP